MGLRLRFNLILTTVFAAGLIMSAFFAYNMLHRQAREEVIAKVDLMINAARAIRSYTVKEVRPELAEKLNRSFLPQTVPAYAATTTLNGLPSEYKDYTYREAALNPTNPANRAVAWEADIVRRFRRDDQLKQIVGVREAGDGRMLYIATPIKISDDACLTCHSTPDAAPKTLVARYGNDNGFGWQLGEVVAAQIGSVPMTIPTARANRTFTIFMLSLALVFGVYYILLNITLSGMIIKPITQMAKAADELSVGNFEVPEFEEKRSDEIGQLGVSFNRLRRSLDQAMKMIK